MGNPILIMKDGGFGKTPVPGDALLQPGDVFTVWSKDGQGHILEVECKCIAVVPIGVPIEWAMADQANPQKPRPLMLQQREPHEETVYVLQRETDAEPAIFRHSELLAGQEEFDETRPDRPALNAEGQGDG